MRRATRPGPEALLGALVLVAVAADPLAGQRSPLPVPQEVWTLGAIDGAPEEQFYNVRNPVLLADERLVVPDAGSSQIRMFDEERRLLWALGREGDGPGEFRSIEWVHRYRGDSLVVFDARLQRLTLITGGGDVGRVITLGRPSAGLAASGNPPARSFAAGAFADGDFLIRRGEVSVGPGDTTAVRRDRFVYARTDPEGRPRGAMVSLPDDEQFVWAEGGSRSVRSRAFGRTTVVDVEDTRIYVADNTAFRVIVIDADGDTARVFDGSRPPRPVTDTDRERWTAHELEALGDGLMRRIGERALEAMSFPETMPPHGAMLVGDDGRVWLEEYIPPHLDAPPLWTIFGSEGAVTGHLEFQPGFRLTWADATRALGVLQDDLGVERIVLYRLPDL